MHFNTKDFAGKRFGQLEAIKQDGRIGEAIAWLAKCDCGTTKRLTAKNLVRSQSCGCLMVEKRQIGLSKRTKHGWSSRKGSRSEYNVWSSMIDRCHNPKSKGYKDYGGRGIKVCKRWRSFENFIADMGEKPSSDLSIERVNNNKGYSPKNCVWATRKQQSRNNRRTVLITFKGETLCAKDWAARLGLSSGQVITWRIKKGWSIKKALTTKGQQQNAASRLPN